MLPLKDASELVMFFIVAIRHSAHTRGPFGTPNTEGTRTRKKALVFEFFCLRHFRFRFVKNAGVAGIARVC